LNAEEAQVLNGIFAHQHLHMHQHQPSKVTAAAAAAAAAADHRPYSMVSPYGNTMHCNGSKASPADKYA
jgi:hypothetical protein